MPLQESKHPFRTRPWTCLCILAAGGLVLVGGTMLSAQANPAVGYTFSTPPGFANYGSVDGQGSSALFNGPQGVAVDAAGYLYIADTGNHTIRKISPTGAVMTLAGLAGVSGAVDGQGSAARLNFPRGLAVDASGTVYVADSGNHTIRKVSSAGDVTTLAGLAGADGDADGPGSLARFTFPGGVAVDSTGMVYVADTSNHTIRRISAGGEVTTLAGRARSSGLTDGNGSGAQFSLPRGIAVTAAGLVYVADTTNRAIRKITTTGDVTTFATGVAADGVAVDSAGTVTVAVRADHSIWQVSPAGTVSSLAGIPWSASAQPLRDGTATAASFYAPSGVGVDANGTIYVADTNNCAIRKISANASVTTLAGAGPHYFRPLGVAVDGAGNVYVANYYDAGYAKVASVLVRGIFKISREGTVTKLSDVNAFSIAADENGNLFYKVDNSVQKLSPTGVTSTLAGNPTSPGFSDGEGSAARFSGGSTVAVDRSGNVYLAEIHTVRKITAAGVVTTLAGNPDSNDSVDGVGSAAHFAQINAIAVGGRGTVYVLDSFKTVRKITSVGVVTTLAGGVETGSGSILADGLGTAAGFFFPRGLAADDAGNVYVAGGTHQTIRKISAAGEVVTIGGAPGLAGDAEGTGPDAQFFYPWGIAVDGQGILYVADSINNKIRKGTPPMGLPRFVTQPSSQVFALGYSVTFVATTTSDGFPAIYQWLKNGMPIVGATSSYYSLPSATMYDAGSYSVVATTSSGSASSDVATLTTVPFTPVTGSAADFNGDGRSDLLWSNRITGEVAAWLMNRTALLSSATLGNFLLEWSIVGTGDFNGDGKTDIVWSSNVSGERALWLMNGTNLLGISTLGIFPLEWTVAATGDFNGDGKPDIVWSNSITGERALWLMNGTSLLGVSTLGIFPLEWTVAATGDFNFDGKPDLVWSNGITGERALWLMDGTNFLAASTLGVFPLEWTVAGTADFNADRKPDIIWSNSITGERALWLMNGTQFLAASTLGIFPLEWTVSN